MATLKEEQKRFIVMQLGMFFSPQQVAALVKEEYDLEVSRQHINEYNPEAKHKKPIAKKWKLLHEATRKNYLQDQGSIPIAHQAYRLRVLDDMARDAIKRGNTVHAAAVVQQAAKEVGRVYTARHAYPCLLIHI